MLSKAADRPTVSNESDSIYMVAKAENALVDGDVVQWSDTASSTYPKGVAVEDSVAGDGRVAGVVALGDTAVDEYAMIQVQGYNTNITTDGNVASSDLWLTAGSAVAIGATNAEVNADITTANIAGLADLIGWNVTTDSGTVGEGYIKTLGNL